MSEPINLDNRESNYDMYLSFIRSIRDSNKLKYARDDPIDTRLAGMRLNLAVLQDIQSSLPEDPSFLNGFWWRVKVAIKNLQVDIDAVRLGCFSPNSSTADIISTIASITDEFYAD
jgi:hypothetical protein